jgi:hypothetical protein
MRCRRIRGALARRDAIGETNPAERVSGEVESHMPALGGFNPSDALWMTEEVLRHATRPAVNSGQRGGFCHAKSRADFLDGEHDQRIVVRRQGILLARPPDEDPD